MLKKKKRRKRGSESEEIETELGRDRYSRKKKREKLRARESQNKTKKWNESLESERKSKTGELGAPLPGVWELLGLSILISSVLLLAIGKCGLDGQDSPMSSTPTGPVGLPNCLMYFN